MLVTPVPAPPRRAPATAPRPTGCPRGERPCRHCSLRGLHSVLLQPYLPAQPSLFPLSFPPFAFSSSILGATSGQSLPPATDSSTSPHQSQITRSREPFSPLPPLSTHPHRWAWLPRSGIDGGQPPLLPVAKICRRGTPASGHRFLLPVVRIQMYVIDLGLDLGLTDVI